MVSGKGKWVWVCGRTSHVLPCRGGARILSVGWAGVASSAGAGGGELPTKLVQAQVVQAQVELTL